MSRTIAERAAAGAVFLDERLPGWHERIDLGALRLDSPCRCVLGQLDGGGDDGLSRPLSEVVDETPYLRQIAVLGVGVREAYKYGFSLWNPGDEYAAEERDDSAWGDLSAAWAAQVSSRRGDKPGMTDLPLSPRRRARLLTH
jgi:hypothetical protein